MIKKMMAITAGIVLCFSSSLEAETIYGVTDTQFLVSWDSATPNALQSGTSIQGLQSNETILGIDFRPATGELYALGSSSRLYTLNTATGMTTMVGSGAFMPPTNGSSFGFDFNPVIDKIRLDSDVNANYVLDPDAGTATVVTSLFYGPGDTNEGLDPNVINAAYTNSVAGATSTQLYAIDSGLDILTTQANSAGTLGTVGALNVNISTVGGFDISGATGVGFVAVEDVSTSTTQFSTIDLSTGALTLLGEVGGGSVITALAVAPGNAAGVPEPTTAILLSVCFGATLISRSRAS